MSDEPERKIASELGNISLFLFMIAICQMITCNGCNTPAKAAPIPHHVNYVLQNWQAVDVKGKQVGFDFYEYARSCMHDGQYRIMIWDRNVGDPNTVKAIAARLQQETWDEEGLLEYIMGEDYIPPSMADANEIIVEWMNK